MSLKMSTLCANTCRLLQETFLGGAVALCWKPRATTTAFGGWPVRSKQGTEQARSFETASLLRIAYQQKPHPVAGTHKVPLLYLSMGRAARCIQAGPCAPAQSPPAPHSLLWLQLSAPWGWAGDGLSMQAVQDTSLLHMLTRWRAHHCPTQPSWAWATLPLLLSSKKTISGHLACSVKQPLCDILSATNNWKRPA